MAHESEPGRDDCRDFFVSHASVDHQWAEWVGLQLTAVGYSVELGIWEWTPGQDFVAAMQAALRRADRFLAIYTSAYFTRGCAQAEHRAAFAAAVGGRPGRVIPVRVDDCDVPELYASMVRIELGGLDEAAAIRRLIDGVSREAAATPRQPVAFPNAQSAQTAVAGAGSVAGADSAIGPGLVAGTGSVAAARFPRRLPPLWNVPRRNPFFTGRDELLDTIHRRLHSNDGSDQAVGLVPLQGMGGVGKTQLAFEYAHRHAHEYQLVWWVDADTRRIASTCLVDLAEALGLPVSGPRQAVVRQLWYVLRQRTDWLLIYDNVDDPQAFWEIQPPDSGRLLLTSRSPAVIRFAPTLVEVGEFARPESIHLLRQLCPTVHADELDVIAEALGDLPLAVAQAGCFLAETGLAVVDYLHLLSAQPQAAGLADPTVDRHPGLAAVVAASRERLAEVNPAAVELLDQMAFLAPEPLPITPAGTRHAETRHGSGRWGVQVGDAVATTTLVRQLTGIGLARRSGTSLHIHRLVQALVRIQLSPAARAAAQRDAQRLLATADTAELDVGAATSWPAFAALTPHVEALVQSRGDDADGAPTHPPFRGLLVRTADYAFRSAQYDLARRLAGGTHSEWCRSLGPDHPDTLRIANIYAMTLSDGFGDFQAARALLEDTIGRMRHALGDDHPDALHAAWALAYTLGEDGEESVGRRLHQETLARKRRVLGDDHPDTFLSAHSLGGLLTKMGRHADARILLEDNLARRRALLGDDHPDTLRSAWCLGIALRGLGRCAEARELHQDVLARTRRQLGEIHPVTLGAVLELARDLIALGLGRPARDLLVEFLPRAESLLGPTTVTVVKLGQYLVEINRTYFEESLEDSERSGSGFG